MSGAIHTINRFKVRWEFGNKYRITYPNGQELWTNSFKIIRKTIENDKSNRFEEVR